MNSWRMTGCAAMLVLVCGCQQDEAGGFRGSPISGAPENSHWNHESREELDGMLADARLRMQLGAVNIAHSQTVGYRRVEVWPVVSGQKPRRVMEQGAPIRTGRELDVMIFGEGFFKLSRDGTEEVVYVRAGALKFDRYGVLVTDEGWRLEPALAVPMGMHDCMIPAGGQIQGVCEGSVGPLCAGQIQLAVFESPERLESTDGVHFRAGAECGVPKMVNPGTDGGGTLLAIRGGHMPAWPQKPPEPPVMSTPGTPDASSAAESHVTFPERPATGSISASAERFSVRLSGTGPGANMQVMVYLPRGMSGVARHSLGCVFIAPAGTSMLNGSELGGGDSPEHLPYAGAGYAVCAYELDGSKPDHSTVGEMATAIRAFRAARFGLTNAHNAIEYVLAKFPEVDSDRLYAAGHSSAGTLALLLAADEPRIKGCLAYAPGTDILHFQKAAFFDQMERPVPEVRKYAREGSPIEYVGTIRCPVFLFHAGDDTVVSSQSIQDFAGKLQKAGKLWEEKDVASGGHYDSMIREGIPAGIAWLKRLPTERGK